MTQPAPSAPDHDDAGHHDPDARDFEAFARGQDPLDVEAATWVARRRNGLDADGEAALQAWLAADPRHAAAFDDMDDTFGRVRGLPGDEIESLKAGIGAGDRPAVPQRLAHASRSSASVPPRPAAARSASPGRRAWLRLAGRWLPRAALTATAITAVGSGWMRWRREPIFVKTYATERGRQIEADLPDHSLLRLDTETRVEVRLYRDRRETHLADGRVMLSVRPDPERPFHVLAGALRITVVGTTFSVRHTRSGLHAGHTVVAVEEGRVSVVPVRPAADDAMTAAAHPLELVAGQSVVADATGQLGDVTRIAPAAAASWRNDRISFDDTPLAQALAELERYASTGLMIRDPAVAAMRVGGSYDLKHLNRFAEALPQLLPVRLERRGGITEIVAR